MESTKPAAATPAKQKTLPSLAGIENRLKFIDIGVNLTDPVFKGVYRGKRAHEDDFAHVLSRSKAAGVRSMIITGTNLPESKEAIEMAKEFDFYATVGCHPTRTSEMEKFHQGPKAYLDKLEAIVKDGIQETDGSKRRAIAIGECGLDYDRLHFSSKELQLKHFRPQLALAKKYSLPLFLHSRAAHQDFVKILREEGFGEDGGRAVGGRSGVVHSFTGTKEEMEELMNMGFYISFNGCSMKTAEQLEMIKAVRLDRLILETDAPWCSCTGGHASKTHLENIPVALKALFFPPNTKPEQFAAGKPVKGRNEPTAIGGIAWVVQRLLRVPFEEVMEAAWKNTIDLFGLDEAGLLAT